MKLLYITQFFAPEITAAAFRAYEHCQIWENEIDITVYTSNPNYPKGELHPGYSNKIIDIDSREAYKLVRSKTIIKKNISKVGRLISTLSFLIIGIYNILFNRKHIGEKFDCVLGTSGPIFAGILAYIYAKIYKAKFVFEIRDITYIQMVATMSEKKSMSVKIMKFLELYLCKKADKVVVVTNGFYEELIDQGIKSHKIVVIPNGVIVKEFPEYTPDKEEMILTYAGTIGVSQDLLELVEFFKDLEVPNKQLKIIGEGAEKDKIKEYLVKEQIENIIVYDAMNGEEFNNILANSTFGIVKLKNHSNFNKTVPSKIYDLMNRGLPILYLGPEGEASYMIQEAGCGVTLTSVDRMTNIETFTSFIENEQNLYRTMKNKSNSGIIYLKKFFDREKLAQRYLEELWTTERRKGINHAYDETDVQRFEEV